MSRTVNTDQARAWNGPEGRHWAKRAERGQDVNDALHRYLFAVAAIGEADRVLDVGCGAGRTTRLAAAQARHGQAVGIDLSVPMLDRARAAAAAEGASNVRFIVGDAQAHPFPEGQFDVVISQFGVMFFADPGAAFANIGRALRPGGRLVFVCPQQMSRNDWYTVPMSALLGGAPPEAPDGPGMFSLADPDRIDAVLTGAGFRRVRVRSVEEPLVFGPDLASAVDFFLGSGPVRAFLDGHPDVPPERARDTLTATLRPFRQADAVRLPGAFWLVSANRPGPDMPRPAGGAGDLGER